MVACSKCGAQISGEAKFCPVCGAANVFQEVGVLPAGTILQGRYRIEKTLGKGGFGITYRAFDGKENAKVAIKEYYPNGMAHRDTGSTQVFVSDHTQTDSFRAGADKFCEEAKTIARFNGNPNIVGVHDFFYENGTAYFAMEYLDGVDLKHYIKQHGGKLSQENVLHIAKMISDALLITHSMNVLHRDISPDNIYILNNGNIKLIDFGAARQVMNQQSKSLSVILKQGFAPLEQYQRKGKQGAWTDIYALGATLYYALTGKVPDDATERLDDPELGDAQDYGVDEEFWRIINKCMAVRAADRYQSVVDFKADLNKLSIDDAKPEKLQNAKSNETGASDISQPQNVSDRTMAFAGGYAGQHAASGQQYGASGQQYGASGQQYGASGGQYGTGGQQPYGSSGGQYGASGQQYAASGRQYGTDAQPAAGSSMIPGGYAATAPARKKGMKLAVIITAVAITAIALILVFVVKKNKPAYIKVAENYLKALADCDYITASEYCVPSRGVRNLIISYAGGRSKGQLQEDLRERYGNDVKVTYKIIEKNQMGAYYIKSIEEELEDSYDYSCTITDCYAVSFEMNYKGSKKSDKSNGIMYLVKINDAWYTLG